MDPVPVTERVAPAGISMCSFIDLAYTRDYISLKNVFRFVYAPRVVSTPKAAIGTAFIDTAQR